MKKPLLFFLLLFSISVHAQNWFPIGAKWTYSFTDWMLAGYTYPVYTTVIGDTVINGKTCSILKGNSSCSLMDTAYVYEESDVVYHYDGVSDTFYVLYDFSKNTGQSWKSVFRQWGTMTLDTLTFIVDSISLIDLNGFPARIQYTTKSPSLFWEYWNNVFVEYIGETGSLFPHWALCDPYNNPLRCYSDSILGSVEFVPVKPTWWRGFWDNMATNCDFITYPGIDENKISSLNISPNPATTSITISTLHIDKGAKIEVYNTYGQLMMRRHATKGDNNIVLNIESLPAGIYFMKFMGFTAKFVKQY